MVSLLANVDLQSSDGVEEVEDAEEGTLHLMSSSLLTFRRPPNVYVAS